MSIIVTYLALVALTAIAVAVRLLWPRVGSRRRRQLMLLLALLLLPTILSTLSRWDTTIPRLNASLFWIHLFAYELCAISFTLLRPRLITSLIAVILTLPIFSASVVGPASGLFSAGDLVLHPAGEGYFLELVPWSSGPGNNSGSDFTLFYQPAGLRFLRRPFMGSRLYNSQCRTPDSTASVDARTAHISVHCPPFTAGSMTALSGTELDYLIPRGALSPALAHGLHR